MAENTGISAEAQHVLNSLEAHLAAVKRAAESAEASVLAKVESAWEDVQAALENWGGLHLSGAGPGEPADATATGSNPNDLAAGVTANTTQDVSAGNGVAVPSVPVTGTTGDLATGAAAEQTPAP